MKEYPVLIERCLDTGMFVASVPGVPGAQAQGGSPEDACAHIKEILGLLAQEGEPKAESEFVEMRTITLD